jgi:methylenetetrahydrofolate dehydrogenase (NADP+) / methenyltetrahydrofolate cyclohydrolase
MPRIASLRRPIDSASFFRGQRIGRAYCGAVTATPMDGRALAARIREEVAREVDAFPRPVGLATVLVGDDPASDVYIRMKHKATVEVGIEARDLRLPTETAEDELLALVRELNSDDAIDGILVQLPLPEQIDEGRVIRAVDPVKDVDGFHPVNAGLLLAGTPGHVPGTPLGVLALLDEYGVELKGANSVVIGRSDIVGKPVALLLLHRHATVTICHSRTRDLAAETARADVVVAAVGVPGIVTPEMVRPGAAVVDVGINRTENGLVGDVDPAVAERAGLLTPVPGGVGPMTIAMLLRSTIRAARYRLKELAHPAA